MIATKVAYVYDAVYPWVKRGVEKRVKELLKIHSFKILMMEGSCAQPAKNMKFKRLIGALDRFFAKIPSISYRIVILSKRQARARVLWLRFR